MKIASTEDTLTPELQDNSGAEGTGWLEPEARPDGARPAGLLAAVLTNVLAYATLLWHFRPNLLLRPTLTTGGDTGSHHYTSKAFDEFFPFALGGWATGWFAGMPMLEFYFPLPYLLIWLLEHVTGYAVAFKLVTVLGTFALPIVAYLLFRLLDAPRIVAALAPAGAITFLWIEGRNAQSVLGVSTDDTNLLDIFGGFITSTLAGEFAYSLGLALVLVALGLLYRATRRIVEDGRRQIPWGLVAAAGTVIGLAALSHAIPLVLLGIASPALVIGRPWRRRLAVVASSVALGAGVAAFWLIPAAAQREFTAPSIWTDESGLQWIVPIWYWPVLTVAVAGLALAIWKRRPGALVLAWTGCGSVLLFLITPHVGLLDPIVNGRFLPAWYLMTALLAAWGLGELANLASWPGPWAQAALAVLLGIALASATLLPSTKVRFWIRHNYQGYEAQEAWPELQALMRALDDLPDGRVMWEYNKDYSRFGTPRALENIPFFTDKDTMEGLLIESSASAQAHFYLQGLASPQATGAVPGYPYPRFDPERAVALMQTFGIRYFVAESSEIIAGVGGVEGVAEIDRTGRFVIFEIQGGSLVRVPSTEPVYVDPGKRDWRDLAWQWLRNPALADVPVTFGPVGKPDVSTAPLSAFESAETLDEIPELGPRLIRDPGPVLDVHMERTTIAFSTDRVGEPHLVAVSYFPNWVAEGAEGPYLVTPSLMLVIPTERDVRLVYRPSDAERTGQAISLAALAVLAFLVAVTWRRRRDAPARSVNHDHRGAHAYEDGAGIS